MWKGRLGAAFFVLWRRQDAMPEQSERKWT